MPASGQTVRIVPLSHVPSLLHYSCFSVPSLLVFNHYYWVKGVQATFLSKSFHDVMVSAGCKVHLPRSHKEKPPFSLQQSPLWSSG